MSRKACTIFLYQNKLDMKHSRTQLIYHLLRAIVIITFIALVVVGLLKAKGII